MKPVFPYPGGKSKLLSEILPLIPRTAHTFVEPFSGGLAVLLAHETPFPREVVNDIDSGLIDFYRCAAAHPAALLAELRLKLASREEFAIELAAEPRTQLQRAARWYFLTRQSFGAQRENYGRGKDMFHGVDVAREAPSFTALSKRLQNAIFTNSDALDCIRNFDSPDTFFFCDPPYVSCGRTAYRAFSEDSMTALRDVLSSVKGKWLLTCDDSPQTRRIFADFPLRETRIKYSITRLSHGAISRELIVLPKTFDTSS